MVSYPVMLVAFQEQDNLGIGYIASVLIDAGIGVKIIDFNNKKENILENIQRYKSQVVGFSIIFQYHIEEFKNLIDYLRTNSITSHFCAGGHYPSLRNKELLDHIPNLDSIVICEGEHTFLELSQTIIKGKDWKRVDGIAYIDDTNNRSIATSLRPLETNLDSFPIPVRGPLKEYAYGKKYATILAGRGCHYHCSFCSIREFYAKPKGAVKRIRKPIMVVQEMDLLYNQLDCSIFMFQDDDFPLTGKKEKSWAYEFCEEIDKRDLKDTIAWKINCRADEVQEDIMIRMKNSGLFLVYLGIESGTDSGLKMMNKQVTAQDNRRAIDVIKKVDLTYDFGFMLFDPYSTFQSIGDNIDFLESICSDGSSPISFCKMLPYAETQIEKQLTVESRLKGTRGFLDYDFLDSRIDYLYTFISKSFEKWINTHEGILNLSRWTRYNFAIAKRFYFVNDEISELRQKAQSIFMETNDICIELFRDALSLFESKGEHSIHQSALGLIDEKISCTNDHYSRELQEILKKLTSYEFSTVQV